MSLTPLLSSGFKSLHRMFVVTVALVTDSVQLPAILVTTELLYSVFPVQHFLDVGLL